MNRRAVLQTLLLVPAVAGCCDVPDGDDYVSSLPPWHLWGNTAAPTIHGGQPAAVIPVEQLVHVVYGRPETWEFMFSIQVTDYDDGAGGGGGGDTLFCTFALTIGVGRTTLLMPNFLAFAIPLPGSIGTVFHTTTADNVRTGVGASAQNIIDHFTAQQINIQASLGFTNPLPAGRVSAQITAMVAPRTHIRPEWFLERFPGGETEGH